MAHIFIWLICGLATTAHGIFDTNLLVNLTQILVNHYDSSCIKLIHKTNLTSVENQQIFTLFKALALKTGETVAVHSYEKYIESRKTLDMQRSSCLKPIKYVIGARESRREFAAMSKTSAMGNSLWLVALNSSIHQFFADAKVPFNTELIIAIMNGAEKVELKEVYRVDDSYPLRINDVGYWTEEDGLCILKGNLYSRRSDLEGKVLKTGSIENWPLSSFKGGKWDGYFPRIWKELEKLINCTTVPLLSVDNYTGALRSNGTWSGLVGMAFRGELDVIVSEISINDERSAVLKFSRPVLKSNYQVFFCAIGSNLKWSAVLHPFSHETWMAVGAWVIVGTIAISVCYCINDNYDFEDDDAFSPMGSFFFILQSLCQQGYPTVPRLLACKIIFMTSYLLSAVLIPSYSASLIYSLTHHTPNKPFDSLEEFLSLGNYELNVIRHSAQQTYFKRSSSELHRRVYAKVRLNKDRIASVKQGLERTFCSASKQAFFGIEAIVQMHLQQSFLPCCPIVTFTNPLSPVYQSLAFLKDSPYGDLINYKLQMLFSTGVIDNIQNYFMYERHVFHPIKEVEVAIQDVFQIFVLFIIGLICSIVFFFIERCYGNKLECKRRKLCMKKKKRSMRSQIIFNNQWYN